MAKLGINLKDGDGNFLYPRTFVEMIVRHSSNESLATILGNLSKDVVQAKADVNTFLSDFSLSKEVRTALIELRDYLESDDGKITEQLLSTINDLKDNAVKCPDYNSGEYIGTLTHGGTVLYPFTRDDLVFINSIPDYASLDSLLPRILTRDAQTLSLEDKQQARTNVGAVGVKYTDNRGAHLEQAGTEIMPYTKAEYVEYRGSNVDTVINVLDSRSNETKEKVDTFLVDADTSEQAIDKLKELQEYIKNDETSASQMLGDIAQNKQDIADNAEALEKEATRAKQVEMYLESQKANKYGYYEGLSVGVSDNLSGRGEATESEFTMRPSGGENKSIEDGTARINTIKGNSVVHNQLVRYPLFETVGSSDSWDIQNVLHYNIANGVIEVESSVNGESYIDFMYNFEKGNKYMALAYVKSDNSESGVRAYINNLQYTHVATVGESVNDWVCVPLFFHQDYEPDGTERIRLYTSYNKSAHASYKKPQLVNLTKMFNGIDVPTTIEEFYARCPQNVSNEFNEGTIIDNNTTAIKSVGVNAWDGEWEDGAIDDLGVPGNNENCKRTKNFIKVISGQSYRVAFKGNKITSTHALLYRRDKTFISIAYNLETGKSLIIPSDCEFVKITFGDNANPFTGIPEMSFHLVHTGYLNGKYFPYESQIRQLPTVEGGLKSAGIAYDEIRYNKGKDKWEHVQRVGIVDLGKLEWYYGNPSGNAKKVFYSEDVKTKLGITPAQSDTLKSNILNVNYTSAVPYDTLVVESFNKVITAWANQADLYRIVVADTAYTDTTTFKQAMQRVILHYELATPKVTELDVDISPDYRVWDYGTEEAISEVLSTPVRTNSNYGFNAVGQITDNTELIKELLARVAVLEAQIAQANSANVEPIEPIVE